MSGAANRGSFLVGAGIFLSRIAGLVREMVAGRVLGNTGPADALVAALRIPNLLQNLLGEGVLSASFVPVYSDSLEHDDRSEASRLAGAVGAMLMVVTAAAVLVIVFAARPLTRLLAWGLTGDTFELAVEFTRITAIGVGFMVMSAWCLGILNSHRSFFLPYVAPVVWNLAQIVALVVAWQRDWSLADAARGVAVGVAIGAVLQLLVQLPSVLSLARGIRFAFDGANPRVRDVRRRFGSAVLGRGAVQLSAYLDLILASFLAAGALSALFKAQILYTLPVSLFAMSVAAAELPELSRLAGDPIAVAHRANGALRRIAFWMLASSLLLVAAGEPIVQVLFEGGEFTSADTSLVWLILVFYAMGLPAIGLSRMLQNASFAMGDTSGPARIAGLRVAIAAAIGLLLMFPLDRAFIGADGVESLGDAVGLAGPLDAELRTNDDIVRLGALGLAIGSAVGAWIELFLLSRLLDRRLPALRPPSAALWPPALSAAVAFAVTAAVKLLTGGLPGLIAAVLTVGIGGFVYVVMCFRTGVREADMVLRPARRAIWR
ncbi:MAG: murein biosynthesis integral membrane protein MurJ [Actinomycetota bacterium]